MRQELLRQTFIIIGYLSLALLAAAPVLPHLTSAVIGTGGDPWQTMWRFESTWQDTALSAQLGTLPAFLKTEILGGGMPRLVNLSVWPWLWLEAPFGQPLAYNLVWLLSALFAGYGVYWAVRLVVEQLPTDSFTNQSLHAAAFIAGAYYMFLPYRIAHAHGHFGAMQTGWAAWVVVGSMLLIRRPTIIRSALLGLLLLAQAWTEHHYALWLALLALVAIAMNWRQFAHRIRSHWRRYVNRTSPLIIALLIAGISYLPTIRLAAAPDEPLSLGVTQTIRFSADLFSFILPASFHLWWGSGLHQLYGQFFTGNVAEATQYVGLTPLLLIVFFYQRLPGRSKLFWVATAAIFAVISLGPRLHFLGYVSPIPLPYAALQHLPVFSAVRTVARAGSIVGLSLAILLGMVLATQAKRAMSFALMSLIIASEFLFSPIPTQSAVISDVYQALAQLPGKRVIEIPAATNYDFASRALYASRYHGKDVFDNIALERAGPAHSSGKLLPGVRQLLYVRTTDLREQRLEFFGQNIAEAFADVINEQDIAAVIIHPDSLSAYQSTMLRNFLEVEMGVTPTAIDDTLLYPLSAVTRTGDGVYATRGAGWESVGFDRSRDSYFAEISRRATLELINNKSHNVNVTIALEIPPESHAGISLEFAARPLVDIDPSSHRVEAMVTIPPGRSFVDFINGLPDKAIIQNPSIRSTPAGTL